MTQLSQFFDRLTPKYAEAIERCFPRYREMLATMRDYLGTVWPIDSLSNAPTDSHNSSSPRRILDLGCGTGNWSVILEQTYPVAELTLVDISSESLSDCRSRLNNPGKHKLICSDMNKLDLPCESFDIVTSSIAIHHLISPDKKRLFHRINSWLAPGGVFVFADQFRGSEDRVYTRHIERWKSMSLEAGSNEQEFEMWMTHQQDHDHHDTLVDHWEWLQESGLRSIDCLWRCLLWSVVWARKTA